MELKKKTGKNLRKQKPRHNINWPETLYIKLAYQKTGKAKATRAIMAEEVQNMKRIVNKNSSGL